jgi:chitinase
VNDGSVDSAPSSTTMTVTNQPPKISAGEDSWIYRGTWSTVWASGGDPDGQVVSWSWRQVAGAPLSLTGTNQPFMDFFVPKSYKPGNIVFEVTATDNLGAKSSDQVLIQVLR